MDQRCIEDQLIRPHNDTNAAELVLFVKDLAVDLVGVADLSSLQNMPLGLPREASTFLSPYRYAIVMGAQFGKLGKQVPGPEVSLYLEKVALKVVDRLESQRYHALIIHTDDEFDPVQRFGLISLKVLAKAAGLGWQGRSLLIVSPKYGPVHRWIAVLTNMELQPCVTIPNQCGNCSLCVDMCPQKALTLVKFDDHPHTREDVLDIAKCKGDDGCLVCIKVCPWAKGHNQNASGNDLHLE